MTEMERLQGELTEMRGAVARRNTKIKAMLHLVTENDQLEARAKKTQAYAASLEVRLATAKAHIEKAEAEVARLRRRNLKLEGRRFPVDGAPDILWYVIAPCESQALRNHDQTLERLAERGGLSACEAVAVLLCRKWEAMTDVDAQAQLALIEEARR